MPSMASHTAAVDQVNRVNVGNKKHGEKETLLATKTSTICFDFLPF